MGTKASILIKDQNLSGEENGSILLWTKFDGNIEHMLPIISKSINDKPEILGNLPCWIFSRLLMLNHDSMYPATIDAIKLYELDINNKDRNWMKSGGYILDTFVDYTILLDNDEPEKSIIIYSGFNEKEGKDETVSLTLKELKNGFKFDEAMKLLRGEGVVFDSNEFNEPVNV